MASTEIQEPNAMLENDSSSIKGTASPLWLAVHTKHSLGQSVTVEMPTTKCSAILGYEARLLVRYRLLLCLNVIKLFYYFYFFCSLSIQESVECTVSFPTAPAVLKTTFPQIFVLLL